MTDKKYRVAQLGEENVYQVQVWGELGRSFWQWLTGAPMETGWYTHYTTLCGYDCHSSKSEWKGKGAFASACRVRDSLIEEERIEQERTVRFEASLWEDAKKSLLSVLK
jgi:hypothetical protein